jgi:uncharacterized protein (TIRG00374 family)
LKLKESKWLWYGITTLIFAGLIYFADLSKFLDALTSAKPIHFTIALIAGLSFFITNAIVWHSFLHKGGTPVSFWKSLKLFMAGNFMNSVTPLGNLGGEPFMAYVISQNTKANYQEAISSIVSADLVNTLPFITYSAAGILYFLLFGEPTNLIIRAGAFTVVLIVVGAIIAYLLWFEEEYLEKLLLRILDWIEINIGGEKYVESAKERLKETIEMFHKFGEDPKHLFKASLIGHVSVITQIICLYFVLLSLNIDPLLAPITLTVILSGLATFTPTPGGSGTFEAAFAGLIVFLMPVEFGTALAATVLFRLTTYWPGIPLGYIALLSLGQEVDREEVDREIDVN